MIESPQGGFEKFGLPVVSGLALSKRQRLGLMLISILAKAAGRVSGAMS
jgi:hypothetical protein